MRLRSQDHLVSFDNQLKVETLFTRVMGSMESVVMHVVPDNVQYDHEDIPGT